MRQPNLQDAKDPTPKESDVKDTQGWVLFLWMFSDLSINLSMLNPNPTAFCWW